MEIIIFAFVGLVTLAIYGGLLLLPATVAFFIGRLFRPRYLRWVLAGLAIAGPLAWAFASYEAFEDGCASVPEQEFMWHPPSRPESIRVNSRHISSTGLVERGMFRFVEDDFNEKKVIRVTAGQKEPLSVRIPIERTVIPSSEAISTYLVTESAPQRLHRWWNPPLFTVTVSVTEQGSGRVLAKATELLLGGGILGEYLQIFWGDQDFAMLSCGYASPEIGAWRPTLTSRPRYTQYPEADAAFVGRALNLGPDK